MIEEFHRVETFSSFHIVRFDVEDSLEEIRSAFEVFFVEIDDAEVVEDQRISRIELHRSFEDDGASLPLAVVIHAPSEAAENF